MLQLEKEVKERAKKDTQKEQAEAEMPMIAPGGILRITQGGEFGASIGGGVVPPLYANGTGIGPMPTVRLLSLTPHDIPMLTVIDRVSASNFFAFLFLWTFRITLIHH